MSLLQVTMNVLKEKHRKELKNLIIKYCDGEAVCNNMKFTENDKSIFADNYLQMAFKGSSAGFFDGNTGNLVGFHINWIPSYAQQMGELIEGAKHLSPKPQAMLRFDSHMVAGISDYLGSDNYITCEIGYSLPMYRRSGIMEKRIEWTDEFARRQNIDAVMVVANSHILANKLIKVGGFLPLKRVYYQDYRDPVTGEAIFAGLPLSTHQYATQLVKTLNKLER